MENFGPLTLTPGAATALPPPSTTQVRRLLLANQSPYMLGVTGGANGGAQAWVPPHSVQLIPLVRNEFTGMTAMPIGVTAGTPSSNTLWGSWVSPTDDVPGVYPHAIPQPTATTPVTNVSSFSVSQTAYQNGIDAILAGTASARWPMNDAAGSTTVVNVEGTGNGQVTGNVTLDHPLFIGGVATGASFAGASTPAYLPPIDLSAAAPTLNAAMGANTTNYTIFATILTSQPGGTILSTGYAGMGADRGSRLGVDANGLLSFQMAASPGIAYPSNAVVADGAQHLVALSVAPSPSGSTVQGTFYVDGAAAGSFAGPPAASFANVEEAILGATIASWPPPHVFANWYAGAMADVIVTPQTVTADQIAALFGPGTVTITPPVPDGAQLVGYSYHGAPPNEQITWYSGSQAVWHSVSDANGNETAQLPNPIPLATGPLSIVPAVPETADTTVDNMQGTVLWTSPLTAGTS